MSVMPLPPAPSDPPPPPQSEPPQLGPVDEWIPEDHEDDEEEPDG